MALDDEVTNVEFPAKTLGFSEKNRKWTCFYSYHPENMCTANNGIVTFKDGNIYKHNASNAAAGQRYNYFYGNPVDSEVHVVSNEAVSNNKIYKAFSQESDDIWGVNFETPNNQSSNLVHSDFDTRENIHYSDIYNDTNSSGGLLEGDRMRDVTIIAKLKIFKNVLTRLFAVNFNFSPSFRSNK